MINIAPWKIVLTLLLCAYGIFYAAPNLIAPQIRENIPTFLPHKTVNLGLDLRGGAHLLYAVDVDLVLKERAEMMLQDVRKSLRDEKIGYSKIGNFETGVRVVLRDRNDGEAARKILRRIDPNIEIDTQADGVSITAILGEAGIKQIKDQTLAQSIEIVRRRVDELGTTEPIIQRQGEDRLLIQAPGADAQSLKNVIGTTAKLNFHLVLQPGASAPSKTFPDAENPGVKIDVERRPLITGEMLDSAQASFQDGQPVISFKLNNTGARRFCDVTRDNVGRPFAIVLDDVVISAPVIRDAICGGSGVISGSFTVESANELAMLLRAGALPAPMSVVEERSVGPSLGADSIEAGRIASVIGLSLILVFMLIAYGTFGIMANIALLINVCLIFAILSGLQATLTLPGIAGIVLTIGMAVDSNVLIFERIREELRAGRSVISAVDTGYRTAMTTIVDSNLTTLISALVLFLIGTGPIKGFAVTLGIGLVTSFFSAVMVTRLMVVYWLRKRPSSLPM
jgi:preprotein translocase subunit SecD